MKTFKVKTFYNCFLSLLRDSSLYLIWSFSYGSMSLYHIMVWRDVLLTLVFGMKASLSVGTVWSAGTASLTEQQERREQDLGVLEICALCVNGKREEGATAWHTLAPMLKTISVIDSFLLRHYLEVRVPGEPYRAIRCQCYHHRCFMVKNVEP